MNAGCGTMVGKGSLLSAALLLIALAPPLQAETRAIYELSYTPGQDALSTLDVFPGAARLRPGFDNDVQGSGRALNLEVRSSRAPSLQAPGFTDQVVETTGGFIQRFGSSGFGYGVDLGLGLHSSVGNRGWQSDELSSDLDSSLMVTDLSTGPTFEFGNLRSRVRVGVRYPLLGDSDAGISRFNHRGDTTRSAGYLSLDSRLRFSNQTEMSLSLFYDDYAFGASHDWLSDDLEFRSGSAGGNQSVVGFEMGLNF